MRWRHNWVVWKLREFFGETRHLFGVIDPFIKGSPCAVSLAVRHIPPSDTVSAGSRYSALHQVVGVVVVEFPVVDRRFVENRVEHVLPGFTSSMRVGPYSVRRSWYRRLYRVFRTLLFLLLYSLKNYRFS